MGTIFTPRLFDIRFLIFVDRLSVFSPRRCFSSFPLERRLLHNTIPIGFCMWLIYKFRCSSTLFTMAAPPRPARQSAQSVVCRAARRRPTPRPPRPSDGYSAGTQGPSALALKSFPAPPGAASTLHAPCHRQRFSTGHTRTH